MILCAGEALIDMLPRETQDNENAFMPVAGGAVFNTSIALGRLGAPVSLFTGLSNDMFGDILREQLTTSHVDGQLAHQSDRPTTLAFVKLTNGHASYAFIDENTAGRMLTEADLPEFPDALEALFCGGISLAVEPCADAYHHMYLHAPQDCLRMLDPNIRPSFIKNASHFRARIEAMIACSDIVKLSDEDLDWLLPDLDTDTQLARILEMGAQLICYTEGSKGVRGITADLDVHVKAQTATVVDTVGAGDTFNAGFLAGLKDLGFLQKASFANIKAPDLSRALSWGTKAAAITVSRAGANPPWRKEIDV